MFLRLSVLIAGVLTLTALASVSRATNILVAPGFETPDAPDATAANQFATNSPPGAAPGGNPWYSLNTAQRKPKCVLQQHPCLYRRPSRHQSPRRDLGHRDGSQRQSIWLCLLDR